VHETLLVAHKRMALARPDRLRVRWRRRATVRLARQWLGGMRGVEIEIEREQVPQILDATEMIRLNVSRFVGCSLGFFVIESNLELFENGVAQFFEQMNVGG